MCPDVLALTVGTTEFTFCFLLVEGLDPEEIDLFLSVFLKRVQVLALQIEVTFQSFLSTCLAFVHFPVMKQLEVSRADHLLKSFFMDRDGKYNPLCTLW